MIQPRAGYPLAPALQTREVARAHAEGELARAVSEHATACRAEAEAKAELEQQLEQLGKAGALQAGQHTLGQALSRSAAYARRQHEIARALRGTLRLAQARVSSATRELTRAQAALSEAFGAERALELDHARYDHTERAREQRREQDEHDERAAQNRRTRS